MTDTPFAAPTAQIHQIKQWFQKAVPSPEMVNLSTQIGVHLEEIAEMVDPLRDASLNQTSADQLTFLMDVINHAAKQFKSHSRELQLDLRYVDRKAILDALCDQIVTAVGMAHMYGMDIEGALQEVANSNDSKFDDDGQPIFNENRKIMKGQRYVAPDLSKYI